MKIVTGHFKDVQLIAAGSSTFELANRLNEPLTARKWGYRLLRTSDDMDDFLLMRES